MRRLLNIGTAFVFVLSCWGGAFAAPCPHGCHVTAASHALAYAEQPAPEPAGHCHTAANEGKARQMPETSGHELPDVATYEVGGSPAGAQTARVFGAACDHCVVRGEVPSSSFAERELSQTKTGDAANAPVAGGRVIHAAAGFVKEIIPYEDGPPSPVHRHVLIGVFRI